MVLSDFRQAVVAEAADRKRTNPYEHVDTHGHQYHVAIANDYQSQEGLLMPMRRQWPATTCTV